MSLELSKGIEVKTQGEGDQEVYIGGLWIPLQEFLDAAYYVVTNTDLRPDDPRFKFLQKINDLILTSGYNKNQERFADKSSATPLPKNFGPEPE